MSCIWTQTSESWEATNERTFKLPHEVQVFDKSAKQIKAKIFTD